MISSHFFSDFNKYQNKMKHAFNNFLLVLILCLSINSDATTIGTTPYIKEIFLGKCYYYIEILQVQNINFNSSYYNCSFIWEKFYGLSKNSSCTIEDFDEFFKYSDQNIIKSRSVFWSGTYFWANLCKLFTIIVL